MAKTRDYYDVLGVPRTASQKDIGAAFRKLARKHHPDLNAGDKQAELRFKEISEAHEVLSDPEKKKLYDAFGSDWAAAKAAGVQPGEGKDLRVVVPVPLNVALNGGEVAAPTLKGGRVQFKVPPETQNGTKIRLRGLGLPDPKGGPAGDLYAEIKVQLPVPMDERTRKWASEQPV